MILWITLRDFKLKKDFIRRKKCVLCGSLKLKKVLNFQKTPLANSYIKSENTKEKFYPLVCVLCNNCKHLQLQHLVNPLIMFEDYMYVSGTSPVLKKHFENYFQRIKKTIKLNKNTDKILDIACNDGTFLEFFKKDKFNKVIGIEPAKNLKYLNKNKKIDINTAFFNHKNSFKFKKKYKNFKIITANNVFAHVPDLRDFALGVKNILSDKGLFIFEVSYLVDVLNKLTFDTIYHEHMSYHSLKPLIKFFNSMNLEIVDFDLIEAQGGSIRVFVAHKGDFKVKKNKIMKQIKIEEKQGIFTVKKYFDFFKRIKKQKEKINKLINKNKNKFIVGYGAPAKVTTFCHVFNLGKREIRFIADDNDLKQNKYTPGKNIKIINFNHLMNINFDYIIILAWNFSEAIMRKLKKNIRKRKYKIIIPFPNLKVV